MFSVKDIRKLVVVSIIGACAVFVANLFLNFYLDIEQLEISKTNPMIQTTMMPRFRFPGWWPWSVESSCP